MGPAEIRNERVVELFAILLATVRALLRNNAAKPVLLNTYDEISQHILAALRDGGLSDAELLDMERSLARLRLALDSE